MIWLRYWLNECSPPSLRLAMMKRKMERQQQAQSIRMRYVDLFAAVLSSEQVSRFFEVESEIQHKLMQRRQMRRRY